MQINRKILSKSALKMPFTIWSVVSGAVGIASIFTPLPPVITVPAAVYATSNSVYEGALAAEQLYDNWNRNRRKKFKTYETARQVAKIVSVPLNYFAGFDIDIFGDQKGKSGTVGKIKTVSEVLNFANDVFDFYDEFDDLRFRGYQKCKEYLDYKACKCVSYPTSCI